jgi:hypothetical protein
MICHRLAEYETECLNVNNDCHDQRFWEGDVVPTGKEPWMKRWTCAQQFFRSRTPAEDEATAMSLVSQKHRS